MRQQRTEKKMYNESGRGWGVEGRDLSSQLVQNDLEPTQYSILFGTGNVSCRNVELAVHLQLLPISRFSNFGAVNIFIKAGRPCLAEGSARTERHKVKLLHTTHL